MNWKKIVVGLLFVDFVLFTGFVLYQHGISGLFGWIGSHYAGMQVFADLVIALAFVLAWMIPDAKKRGMSPLPYVLLTLGLGSIGPLLYFILRKEELKQVEPS